MLKNTHDNYPQMQWTKESEMLQMMTVFGIKQIVISALHGLTDQIDVGAD